MTLFRSGKETLSITIQRSTLICPIAISSRDDNPRTLFPKVPLLLPVVVPIRHYPASEPVAAYYTLLLIYH